MFHRNNDDHVRSHQIWDWIGAALFILLVADLFGLLDLIHPRKCPACERPYHRGEACDWTADA